MKTPFSPRVRGHLSFISLVLCLLPVTTALATEGIPAEITGVLTILHTDDFEKQQSEFLYFLDDKVNKRKFNLRFQGEPPENIGSGATIKVRGMLQGQNVMFADSSSSIQTLAPAAATVSGDQNTLVLVTNFTDAAVSCPVTAVQDLVFTDPNVKSIDDFYQETSFKQIAFTGAVAAVNINVASTDTCTGRTRQRQRRKRPISM